VGFLQNRKSKKIVVDQKNYLYLKTQYVEIAKHLGELDFMELVTDDYFAVALQLLMQELNDMDRGHFERVRSSYTTDQRRIQSLGMAAAIRKKLAWFCSPSDAAIKGFQTAAADVLIEGVTSEIYLVNEKDPSSDLLEWFDKRKNESLEILKAGDFARFSSSFPGVQIDERAFSWWIRTESAGSYIVFSYASTLYKRPGHEGMPSERIIQSVSEEIRFLARTGIENSLGLAMENEGAWLALIITAYAKFAQIDPSEFQAVLFNQPKDRIAR
jgi:hypothetical protein